MGILPNKNKITSRPSRLRTGPSRARCLHLPLAAICVIFGMTLVAGAQISVENIKTLLNVKYKECKMGNYPLTRDNIDGIFRKIEDSKKTFEADTCGALEEWTVDQKAVRLAYQDNLPGYNQLSAHEVEDELTKMCNLTALGINTTPYERNFGEPSKRSYRMVSHNLLAAGLGYLNGGFASYFKLAMINDKAQKKELKDLI